MTTLAELGQKPAQPPWYAAALAEAELRKIANWRPAVAGVAQDDFDWVHHDTMVSLAAEAGIVVDIPAGKPDPARRQAIVRQITELNAQLGDESLTDEQKADIRQQIQDLTVEAQRLEAAGG